MTITEAISRIDIIKPNGYTQDEKVRWLSTMDSYIKTEIIDNYEDADKVTFKGYDENTPMDTVLLVPAPYDEIYLFWLESKIDYWNGEMGKYNNSISMYNMVYAEFGKHYNRNHMPKGLKIKLY